MADKLGTSDESGSEIAFDFVKSGSFRVVRAHGGVVSGTPHGDVNISVYSERWPIPQRIVLEIDEQGVIGSEIPDQRLERDAVVREVEVCMNMTLDEAEQLAGVILQHVERLRGVREGGDVD